MRPILLLLCSFLFSFLVSCSSEKAVEKVKVIDVRAKLYKVALQTEDFPDGKEVKCTAFHFVGSVDSDEGKIYVMNMRAVLTGMLSPRGLGATMFFSEDYKFLGKLSHHFYPQPLWCEGSHLYFAGRSVSLAANTGGREYNGNALDLSEGWEKRKMVDIYEYGSSGGIKDPIPTTAQREREVQEPDSYEWDFLNPER